jgi:hypothetical protein
MKRNSLNLLCVLVVGALFVSVFAPIGFVGAGPGQQHNIYGLDAQSGADIGGATSIASGSEITGWIDGVQYGINTTIPAFPSRFDLYVEGDDWGVDPDDFVKDGGYNGDDPVQYFLDYDPSDYYLSISTFTSTFMEGDDQNEGMFFDTKTNTDSVLVDTHLRGLKINEIVFDPWAYVYIYDPGGELDKAKLTDPDKGYYMQRDDSIGHTTNGEIFDFNTNAADVIQNGPANYYYINISKTMTISSTEDELKLVWKNPGTSGDNIANGTDVIVDRVEWGNFENQHAVDYSWRDYDNTTLSDILLTPAPGQCFRLNTNGTDNDDPENDFGVYARSPWAPGDDIYDMPGPPSDLRVHKVGTDLILNWTAPIVDYGFLLNNIVYYDSDLSDGFQYTTYQLFAPDNSGAGTEDGATLAAGMGTDSNNYAFIVHTTGDPGQGGPNENLVGTNVGYKYVIDLQKNPTTTSQMLVSIPYFCDWTMASDIAGPGMEFTDDTVIDALLMWNYATQKLEYRTYGLFGWQGDFSINPGDTLGVTIRTSSPYSWKIVGAYDDTFEFSFATNPTTTSQTFCSLPFHTTYQMASDIAGPGMDFTDDTIVDTVLKWNYTKQQLDYRTYGLFGWQGDFDIDPMPGGHVGFTIRTSSPVNWKPQVMVL